MQEPTPTATARLATLPLPRLLARVLERAFTGTAVIEAPERHRSALFFERGQPAKVKSGQRVHLLGEILAELGVVEPVAIRAALERAVAERRLLGQVLLQDGKLGKADLATAVREQLQRKIAWLSSLPGSSVVGLYDQVNLIEKWGAPEIIPVSPMPMIWALCRDHCELSVMDGALQGLGDRPLRLHPEAHPALLKLGREEQVLLDVMRARPQPLAVLESCGAAPRERVRRLVYALGVVRQLDLGPGSPGPLRVGDSTAAGRPTPTTRNVAAPASARGHTPSETSAALEELGAELRSRVAALPNQNHYEVLGIARDAETSAIQGLFFQLARRWHPDRIPAERADLRELATVLFARMSEAHGTLTDAEQRPEYDRLLREGGATDAERDQIKAVLTAAAAFQRAEVLVKRQRLQEARAEAKIAAENDPEQVEHLALYAWIQGQMVEAGTAAELVPLIQSLDDCVAKEPDNVRIRLYRAQLLKRAGRVDAAIRDYRHVVELQPRHTEAQRELRLHKMRRSESGRVGGSSQPPAGSKPGSRGTSASGLLGKLFKR